MTKRWKAAWGAGYAAAIGAAVLVMRDANQSIQKIEATRPAPAKTVPTTSLTEMFENRRASGDPPPDLPRTADVNDDGRVELDDILLVLRAFSSLDECETPCPEDICCSGEHRIDLDDILAVLAAARGETDICPRCGPPTQAVTEVFEVFLDGRWVRAKPAHDGTHYVTKDMEWRCRRLPAAEPGD